MLLRRFADDRHRLLVHRLDSDVPHPASVRDVGHRNRGHSLQFPGRDANHDVLERRMSGLEGAASQVIDRITPGTGTSLDDDDCDILAWFLALQWTRHRHTLAAIRRAVAPLGTTNDEDARVLRSSGLIAGAGVLLDAWVNRDDPHARPKDRYNGVVVNLLARFQWRLVRYRRPSLVIGDTTLCMSGVADGHTSDLPPAWADHGAGVGTGTCRRVTAALTPRLGLLLEAGQEPRHMPAARFNQLTVRNSREFVAHAPDWPDGEPRLHAAVLDNLWLQRRLRSAFGPTA
jgi:hypothetical protein